MTRDEIASLISKMNDEAWQKRDMAKAYQLYDDEIVFHRPPFPPVVGIEANIQGDEGMLAAFGETRSTIHQLVVEGDTAVVRWTWVGKHTGTLPTLGVPATGKELELAGCTVYRFKDHKIVEQWEYSDLLGFMQQLGVVTFPG